MSTISFVGQSGGSPASASVPAGIVAGDYIIVYAYKNSVTAPSLGAGYTQIVTGSGNTNSYRVGFKIATGSETTTGTWTNASCINVVVYRGVGAIGGSAAATVVSGATTAIPTIALTNTVGTSWVIAFAGSSQTTSKGTPLAGATTLRGSQVAASSITVLADTNTGVSTFSATTSANGTNAVGNGGSIELIDTNYHVYNSTITFVAPSNGNVSLFGWGGGGAGGGQTIGLNAGNGGGGGAYSAATVSVISGGSSTVTVGAAGVGVSASAGGGGGDTWFGTTGTLLAKGGAGGGAFGGTTGTGGAAASGVGTTKFSGGNGGLDTQATPFTGGGGGGSAGNSSDGGAGGVGTGGTSGVGGTAGTGTPGGAVGGHSSAGIVPGSGGSGKDDNTTSAGFNGAAGKLIAIFIPTGGSTTNSNFLALMQ